MHNATQIGGNHYQSFAIQPIDFIRANRLDFCTGSIIKYVLRHKHKNGREDLEKARHYIDLLIEQEYPDPLAAICARCGDPYGKHSERTLECPDAEGYDKDLFVESRLHKPNPS